MILLRPMIAAEFERFLAAQIPSFAQAKVANGDWLPEEGLAASRQAFARALPQGLETPQQYLHMLVDAASGQEVGWLWFEVRTEALHQVAYLYEITIFEPFRRQGHALAALESLDRRIRELGLNRIYLHVFTHNPGAIELYQKAGYAFTDHYMAKTVA